MDHVVPQGSRRHLRDKPWDRSHDEPLEVDYPTPVGLAHVAIDVPSQPQGLVVLGHGAGGDIDAADLLTVRDAAVNAGWAVARLRQPYRVAGRKAPAPAAALDVAYSAAVAGLRELPGLAGLPIRVGGRSSGARVAARVAHAAGATGLLTLAFPLSPPGRPLVSRIDELTGAGVRTLCLQGTRDAYGSAEVLRLATTELPLIEVCPIADADHSLRTRRTDATTTRQALDAVAAAVAGWLAG